MGNEPKRHFDSICCVRGPQNSRLYAILLSSWQYNDIIVIHGDVTRPSPSDWCHFMSRDVTWLSSLRAVIRCVCGDRFFFAELFSLNYFQKSLSLSRVTHPKNSEIFEGSKNGDSPCVALFRVVTNGGSATLYNHLILFFFLFGHGSGKLVFISKLHFKFMIISYKISNWPCKNFILVCNRV